MVVWTLSDDVLALGPLRLAVQRIALSHWTAGATLRSWGVAPLHRDGNSLLVPCAPDEALWIGAWLEDWTGAALVLVQDTDSGNQAEIELPDDYQLSALYSDDTRSAEPLALGNRPGGRAYRLGIRLSDAQISIDLTLLPPDAWARLARRGQPPLEIRSCRT